MVSRIKQLLDWQQLSPTQFADRIGVGRPVVSHILSERNKPSLDVVLHIRKAFPELSLLWLLEGAGEMLATTTQAAATPPPTTSVAPTTTVPASSPPTATPAPSLAPATAPTALPASRPPQSVASGTARPAISRFQPAKSTLPTQAEANPPGLTTLLAPAPAPVPAPAPEPAAAESQPAPAVAAPAPPPAEVAPAPATSPVAQAALPAEAAILAAGLAGPEKAIRRIVIFYRDGSFADYQPEQ